MRQILQALSTDDEGATAVEYAIMASLIASVIVATVRTLGVSVQELFAKVAAGPW